MKKKHENLSQGKVYITSGFNNTIVTLTDTSGQVLLWGSSGMSGFKGARKSTPFAASTTALNLARKALELGVSQVSVFVKGPGAGRDAAVKSLKAGGLEINAITDVTPIPHNGCRPKKRRRV
ncbi:MAG: 30S ribosomal protein S11 [Patescibacteria group bacterium]|nr:30S ribosomal protein S11 [Patescibacteria group bacterium]